MNSDTALACCISAAVALFCGIGLGVYTQRNEFERYANGPLYPIEVRSPGRGLPKDHVEIGKDDRDWYWIDADHNLDLKACAACHGERWNDSRTRTLRTRLEYRDIEHDRYGGVESYGAALPERPE